MIIDGKYFDTRFWLHFHHSLGEAYDSCRRKSYELRVCVSEAQKTINYCSEDMLFFKDDERTLIYNMKCVCHRLDCSIVEIDRCMECMEKADNLDMMLHHVNKISYIGNEIEGTIRKITQMNTTIPIVLNTWARQIVHKPWKNLLEEAKILYEIIYHYTSHVVPYLQEYKQKVEKAEQGLYKQILD